MAKIQVQGIGVYDDKTLKKKIIDMANDLSKLAKKGEWSKSSENGIRALGRMWKAYQDWSRQNETVNEAKKPIEFKIGGLTFGKDYQGLKSRNGGVRYYYQKPRGAKHMETDYGKFIVKIGQLVDANIREKVAKKLKESVNENNISNLMKIMQNKYDRQGYSLKQLHDEVINYLGKKDGGLVFQQFIKKNKSNKKVQDEFNKTSFSESVNEGLSRRGYIEILGQAKYLKIGVQDLLKSLKKQDDKVVDDVEYVHAKTKLMMDLLKRWNESVNEATDLDLVAEEKMTEKLNITGYYTSSESSKMRFVNVNKLNINSPLEKIIQAYLDTMKEWENSEYGSYPYDVADGDLQYITALLRKKKITNKELNKLYNKFSRDKKYPVIAEQMESINEGKKLYSINPNKIGKVKYSIDFHDGKSKNKDGSPFIGIDTAKTKKELQSKLNKYKSKGYKLVNSVFKTLHEQKLREATEYYKSKRKSDDLFYKKVGNKWYKSLANKKGKVGWYVVKFPQDLDKKDMNKINKTKLPNVLRESVNENKVVSDIRKKLGSPPKGTDVNEIILSKLRELIREEIEKLNELHENEKKFKLGTPAIFDGDKGEVTRNPKTQRVWTPSGWTVVGKGVKGLFLYDGRGGFSSFIIPDWTKTKALYRWSKN